MFLRIKFNYFASLINGMHKFTAIETGRCANMCSIDRASEREGGRTQKLILEKTRANHLIRCVVVVVIGIGIGKALHEYVGIRSKQLQMCIGNANKGIQRKIYFKNISLWLVHHDKNQFLEFVSCFCCYCAIEFWAFNNSHHHNHER